MFSSESNIQGIRHSANFVIFVILGNDSMKLSFSHYGAAPTEACYNIAPSSTLWPPHVGTG